MSDRPELLLIGRLFGTAGERLAETFAVRQVNDFTSDLTSGLTDPDKVRVVAVGMVGSGHISQTVVDDVFLGRFPGLELLACLGVGCEYVDLAATERYGVAVSHTPDVNTEETADTALGMLLSTVRQLPQADRHIRLGRWPEAMFPLTGTLREKRLGILGLGRIGKAIARRAEGFGLEILYHGRSQQPGVGYRYLPSVVALAQAANILMVVVPGGEETRNMINSEVLDALGPDGVLINVSRGSVVDEVALIDALGRRAIKTAGLDAFAHEPHVPDALIAMDHVVLFPHIGSGTHDTRARMADAVVDNIEHWLAGKGPRNRLLAHDD